MHTIYRVQCQKSTISIFRQNARFFLCMFQVTPPSYSLLALSHLKKYALKCVHFNKGCSTFNPILGGITVFFARKCHSTSINFQPGSWNSHSTFPTFNCELFGVKMFVFLSPSWIITPHFDFVVTLKFNFQKLLITSSIFNHVTELKLLPSVQRQGLSSFMCFGLKWTALTTTKI